MKLALFTAAIDGDNSGDAIIETAVSRIIGATETVRLPLTGTIGGAHIAAANACDAAIICGTNLYQSSFACGLTEEVVNSIRVPLIPFGIGASAPMGEIPVMNAAGVAAVRAIHAKCRMGGVRDEASYRFVRSLGIDNVMLTGCPVLFHGLACPDFRPSGEGYTLAPRARLLHIDQRWQARQSETLEILARRYRPRLVLQSPYDLDEAEQLAARHGLGLVYDPVWQADTYIEAARSQRISLGFRLHFAMLSIAYGKPAFLVSHDSRADEFCKLLGLPPLRIDNYSDASLGLRIDAVDFPADDMRRRWCDLADRMQTFISANGLPSRLEVDRRAMHPLRRKPLGRKPKVAILVDTPNWAYDNSMRQVRKELASELDITISYRSNRPDLDPAKFDLLHLCFWGEQHHVSFNVPREKVVKEVSSHRWQHASEWGPISAEEFGRRWLGDCDMAVCTSRRLEDLVGPVHRGVTLFTPNGVDVRQFHRSAGRDDGPLTYGWSGNSSDPVKRFNELAVPAMEGRKFSVATGGTPHQAMPAFYADIDVFLVTSAHEGEPLTLVEAMASGCFPVCSDVGIVPELIDDGINGLIVRDATVEGYRRALDWCDANPDKVRAAGKANSERMRRERNWGVCSQFFARAYKEALAKVLAPRFRNDDVAWDSSLPDLQRFSEVFYKYGLTQIHGVCLNGRNNAGFRRGDIAVEYDGMDSISRLPNAEIRRLSAGMPIAERGDLVAWLNSCPDELALHGLYHTDYSTMSEEEQGADIAEGLREMKRLFPGKSVRYFIAPFNRTNEATYRIARLNGLTVLAEDGVHLEQAVHQGTLEIEPYQWYRYHHHRFYPETKFDFFKLSIDSLDAAFGQCFSGQPRFLGLAEPEPAGPLFRLAALRDQVKSGLRKSAVARRLYRAFVIGKP